jgi:DMSO/TMAO reductase YedYZ molybdopterin-dependent catalytic subunit
MNLFGKDPKQQEKIPTPADAPEDAIVSPDTHRENRIPPNQSRTAKWPVLDTGIHPYPIKPVEWAMRFQGLLAEGVEPRDMDWELFQSLPRVKVFAETHCTVVVNDLNANIIPPLAGVTLSTTLAISSCF